jgi:predicted sugar kinase
MNSHSYIVFDDSEKLKKFINIALQMTIPEDWKIKFALPEFDTVSASQKYKKAAPGIDFQYTGSVVKSKKFPEGRVFLHLLVPRDPSQKRFHSRRSSNIMKFVCHTLAIMIPDAISDT